MPNKYAVLSSTGGAVMGEVCRHAGAGEFRPDLLVTDRACGAEQIADELGISRIRLEHENALGFSNALLATLEEAGIDYVFLFFTRLLTGPILERYRDRLVNFHTSLLPACPGLHGFEDTLAAGALVGGSSVHFVDPGMDTGAMLMQACMPIPPAARDEAALRHAIFAQQCASLAQVHTWLQQGRLEFAADGRPVIRDANYRLEEGFCPALESEVHNYYRTLLQRGPVS